MSDCDSSNSTWKKTVVVYFNLLFENLPEETEEDKNPQSGDSSADTTVRHTC
jgi:hypothetical protein